MCYLFSNQKSVLFEGFPLFKSLTVKLLKTKLKFWLDNFNFVLSNLTKILILF